MGDIRRAANGRDPSVTNGKLKTVFRRVEGCTRLDRMVARRNMEKAGITQICKGNKVGRNNKTSENRRRSDSKFAQHWRDYV